MTNAPATERTGCVPRALAAALGITVQRATELADAAADEVGMPGDPVNGYVPATYDRVLEAHGWTMHRELFYPDERNGMRLRELPAGRHVAALHPHHLVHVDDGRVTSDAVPPAPTSLVIAYWSAPCRS